MFILACQPYLQPYIDVDRTSYKIYLHRILWRAWPTSCPALTNEHQAWQKWHLVQPGNKHESNVQNRTDLLLPWMVWSGQVTSIRFSQQVHASASFCTSRSRAGERTGEIWSDLFLNLALAGMATFQASSVDDISRSDRIS